jgi:hypothetical protein
VGRGARAVDEPAVANHQVVHGPDRTTDREAQPASVVSQAGMRTGRPFGSTQPCTVTAVA